VQTVRGDEASVERRLSEGRLRCACAGVLGPWGHARARVVRSVTGSMAVRPRRARCRACLATHVLLPASLFSRRAFAGVLMWGSVVARAAGVKIAAIAARIAVAASTVGSWLRRIAGRAGWWRQILMGLLAGLDASNRRLVPTGSPLADGLTVLDAVLAVLRTRAAAMSTLTAWELASHLTRAHLFAPHLDVYGCNTSLFGMPAVEPS
jgi:hypothetical protein